MPAFMDCFADAATAFLPSAENPKRLTGKPAIQSAFQQVFDLIRKQAQSGPLYQRIVPQDLQTEFLGTDAALVTFHLGTLSAWAGEPLF